VLRLQSLILLMLFIGCVPAQNENLTTGGAANPAAPSVWPKNKFPVSIKLSNQFTIAETNEIKDAITSWTTHVANGSNFTNISDNAVADKSGVGNLNALLDGEFGIYKAVNWHPQLPVNALAVTQIFGVRRNAGQSNEYVEIVEGDIIFNWTFPYYPTNPNGYDLFSVTIHEMGHFLGLGHITNYALDSVMYPSIGYSTFYFRPGDQDIINLKNKYNYGVAPQVLGLGAARAPASVPDSSATIDDVLHSGSGVKITLELYPNGDCVHKLDGEYQLHHQAFKP
jgi:hypothetical protein